MDIKVFNKKAYLAAFLIVFFGGVVIAVNYYDNEILSFAPFLPPWSMVALSYVILLLLAVHFWGRELDFQNLKYEFVNIVTHKFRTPLTYVTWSVENLKKKQSEEERAASVRQIEAAVERLTEMTGILIDVTKVEEGYSYVFKAENFREIVEGVMKQYADRIREKEITFNIDMAYTLPLISVDVKRMEFVVKTLLENALIYTPKGGHIDIKVSLVEGRAIRFSITDSGIGISGTDVNHVFDKFYRSREATGADTEGMGLGLYISKSTIERHGGRIKAESAGRDKGSTFTFEIPLHHGL